MRLGALWCWYHGGGFRGYQSQPRGPTVQDTLLEALRRAGYERNPIPCGRTDAGVHARMQILSMRLPVEEDIPGVAARLTPHLPPGLGVALSRPAPPRFHAQVSAQAKVYRYRLAPRPSPAWEPFAWQVDVPTDELAQVLALIPGTRDFSAFHHASSSVRPRTVLSARFGRVDEGVWEVELRGLGFARFMVRRLVAAAVAVARGEVALADYQAALEEARPLPVRRAPAHGLVLWEVLYPAQMDPFTALERAAAPGVPRGPPF